MEKEMNERIRLLWAECVIKHTKDPMNWQTVADEFAELIVREFRGVVSDVYRKTPLELCGPLLTVDEEIMKHFYGVSE
jgi:hypothetical protein